MPCAERRIIRMKEIHFFGAGKNGNKAYKILKRYYNDKNKLMTYVDNKKSGEYEGVKISKPHNIDKTSRVIITIENIKMVVEVYLELKQLGFTNMYWFVNYYNRPVECNDFVEDECIDISGWGNCIFPHMELHISDKCNLNCKGCTHFSPLYSEVGCEYDQVIKDVIRIKELFSTVARVDILGGEPFVNTDIAKYIVTLREMMPNTAMDIFTNGLLIPKLSDDVLQCIRDNNVYISITEYKPTHAIIDKITDKLDRFKIRYMIVPYDKRQLFNTPISTSEHSIHPQMCISNGCVTVANGMIARCPTLMYISKFNEYFNKNLPTEGIINLDDVKSGFELIPKFDEEVPLCKHCIKHDVEWSVCGKEMMLQDFAVED